MINDKELLEGIDLSKKQLTSMYKDISTGSLNVGNKYLLNNSQFLLTILHLKQTIK